MADHSSSALASRRAISDWSLADTAAILDKIALDQPDVLQAGAALCRQGIEFTLVARNCVAERTIAMAAAQGWRGVKCHLDSW